MEDKPFEKGQKVIHKGDDMYGYGINTPGHSNQIEVYNDPELRDWILQLLLENPR